MEDLRSSNRRECAEDKFDKVRQVFCILTILFFFPCLFFFPNPFLFFPGEPRDNSGWSGGATHHCGNRRGVKREGETAREKLDETSGKGEKKE